MWYVCVCCFVVCGCAVSRRYIDGCYCDMFSVVNVYIMEEACSLRSLQDNKTNSPSQVVYSFFQHIKLMNNSSNHVCGTQSESFWGNDCNIGER